MKKLILLIALLLPLGLTAKETVIYHTSDVHGFYYPRANKGGFATLRAYINKGPKNYLLLDSGDFSNGTIEAKNSKGIKSVEMMNAMGYDASTIGNHEFDFKENALPNILEKASFPILAANFVDINTKDFPKGVLPYKIYNVDGVKVAVLGLANATPTSTVTKYEFLEPLESLEKYLPEVEKQNPNVVAVILHDSLADDKHGTKSYVSEIATRFGGRIHVVFGGHAHKIFQNKFINGVLFVESGCYLKNVSKVVVDTDDKSGKFKSAKSQLVPLNVSAIGQDESIFKIGESLKEPGADEQVGEIEFELSKTPLTSFYLDSPMDDFIADAGLKYAQTEIFIHNVGGARVGMVSGILTNRNLIDTIPFDNTVKKMTVKGAFLKELVSTSIYPRSLFTYAGMSVYVEAKMKKGKRIIKKLKIWVNGEPLDEKRDYLIATNSFIADGGMEGYLFKQIPAEQKESVGTKTIREILQEALNASEKAPITGRLLLGNAISKKNLQNSTQQLSK